MNDAQLDLVAKGFTDVGKGIFIAAPIAIGTGKLSAWYGLSLMAIAVAIFNVGLSIAGDIKNDPA